MTNARSAAASCSSCVVKGRNVCVESRLGSGVLSASTRRGGGTIRNGATGKVSARAGVAGTGTGAEGAAGDGATDKGLSTEAIAAG